MLRQNRLNQGEALLRNRRDEPLGRRDLAVFEWNIRKDADAASRVLGDVLSSESSDADLKSLILPAMLALARNDLELCAKLIPMMESRLKEDWWDETHVAFIGVVHELLAGGRGDGWIAGLRELLARPHLNYLHTYKSLITLAEAVSSRLPKPHKKFVPALAEAIYEPQRTGGLPTVAASRPGVRSAAGPEAGDSLTVGSLARSMRRSGYR